ncbi:MAG TPA: hypothetical protein VHU19_03880, partial [Pyrinomonadaceae bacterium]|nr:hypothetical protein [Pyrinomonadaceae bacterium]
LVEGLGDVERSAREFLDAGDAESALRILLTLLEESGDGFDYIDDSNGELGGPRSWLSCLAYSQKSFAFSSS